MFFQDREILMRTLFCVVAVAVLLSGAPVRAQDAPLESQAAQAMSAGADAGASQPAASTGGPQPAEAGAGSILPPESTIEAIAFYIIGGAAALCALGCVISTNIVRMATCLFGTLGSVAVLYFLMAANFLGVIQLIVYAGGTLIVIIFGVMLTSKSPWVKFAPRRVEIVAGAVVCLALFVGLVTAFRGVRWPAGRSAPGGFTVEQIGRELLTTYLVPFELASVLLLAVMIGAAYLARAERR
jgi:NADH:ubiquinone oxidoreductase subunit 6 (subunit J)